MNIKVAAFTVREKSSNTLSIVSAATYRWYTDTIDDYIFSEMYPHRFISQVAIYTSLRSYSTMYIVSAATYRWYTDTIDDYIFSEMYPHRFISQSGYLYFSEVQPTDDNRLYKCVVTLSVPMIYNQASNQAPSRTSLGIVLRVTGTGTLI